MRRPSHCFWGLTFQWRRSKRRRYPRSVGCESGFGTGRGFEIFRQALRNLGYIEGKNVIIEHRSAEGRLDRLTAAAEELARLRVDVFLTSSTEEVDAAKNATKTIPIVFYGVSDPVARWVH